MWLHSNMYFHKYLYLVVMIYKYDDDMSEKEQSENQNQSCLSLIRLWYFVFDEEQAVNFIFPLHQWTPVDNLPPPHVISAIWWEFHCKYPPLLKPSDPARARLHHQHYQEMGELWPVMVRRWRKTVELSPPPPTNCHHNILTVLISPFTSTREGAGNWFLIHASFARRGTSLAELFCGQLTGIALLTSPASEKN